MEKSVSNVSSGKMAREMPEIEIRRRSSAKTSSPVTPVDIEVITKMSHDVSL
jgi:hypothetical protein